MTSEQIAIFLHLKSYKRCKKKNRKYYLTIDLIEQLLLKLQYKDYYTGLIPEDWRDYSIDRIDSDKDYQLDNIVITTKVINTMKGHLTIDEFFNNVNKIYLHNIR